MPVVYAHSGCAFETLGCISGSGLAREDEFNSLGRRQSNCKINAFEPAREWGRRTGKVGLHDALREYPSGFVCFYSCVGFGAVLGGSFGIFDCGNGLIIALVGLKDRAACLD